MTTPIYDYKVKNIKGEEVDLSEYQGKVLLIVNTASNCGFTDQYKDLQAIYSKYKDEGLCVLGFPCNQFGNQEPGTESEIITFCETRYSVSFPMFAKVDVNGDKADPLFKFLTEQLPGLAGTKKVKWNFTKFLIDRKGKPLKRFSPRQGPQKLTGDIEKALSGAKSS